MVLMKMKDLLSTSNPQLESLNRAITEVLKSDNIVYIKNVCGITHYIPIDKECCKIEEWKETTCKVSCRIIKELGEGLGIVEKCCDITINVEIKSYNKETDEFVVNTPIILERY